MIVGHASSDDHSVFLFDAFVLEPSGFRRPTLGYQTFAGNVPIEMGREEGRRPPDFVGIVGTTIGTVDEVTTAEAGFLIGLVPDDRVQRVVVVTESGDRVEEPVPGPAFMVALPETFHPELEIEWRLRMRRAACCTATWCTADLPGIRRQARPKVRDLACVDEHRRARWHLRTQSRHGRRP